MSTAPGKPQIKASTPRRSSGDGFRRIYTVVRRIPAGRVASYGQIARLAGYGRNARVVGYALHALPEASAIPWHRIVKSDGRVAFPAGSPSALAQRARLLSEGILFRRDRLNLKAQQWRPEH